MIRKMEYQDLEAAIEVWQKANRQAHGFLPAYFWEQRRAQIKTALQQQGVYVAVEEGRLVGLIGLRRDWVHGLFVLPDCQGHGIGRRLLETLKQRRPQLWLQVYSKNQRALAFYLREGFQICRRSLDGDSNEVKLTLLWQR